MFKKFVALYMACICLFSAMVAHADTVSFNVPTTALGNFTGSGIYASGSITGTFDYDLDTTAASNINFSLVLDGTTYNITGSVPDLTPSLLVFANAADRSENVIIIAKSLIAQRGQTADVLFYSGLCKVQGDSCNLDINERGDTYVSLATPSTTTNAPTNLSATVGDGQVSIAFTAPTDTGGSAITNYKYSIDNGSTYTAFSPAVTGTSVTITGLTNGTSYPIKLRAVNAVGDGTESAAVTVLPVSLGSSASEFANHKATIKNVITGEMSRALRSSIASDQRMVNKSLTRFIADQSGSDANQDVAFFVDGNAELKVKQAEAVVSTQGNFLSQKTTGDGNWRKLAFGDFDVQTDDDKNVSGFLNGRMAFETNLNSTTMFGYFVGGQVGRSILKGTFEGSQNSLGASVGGYLVQTLAKDVYAHMFASLGTNRNSLKLSNGTLDLDSSYSTTTSSIGGSVTGVYAMESFEVWPTLVFTHGVANVGDVGFTGIAYGLTDTTLSLDAGKVSLTSLSFTPEVRKQVLMSSGKGVGSSSMATFAPRYTCEQTGNSSSRECGSGASLGVTTASEDGLTNLNAQIQYDKVGSTARRSLQLSFERKF